MHGATIKIATVFGSGKLHVQYCYSTVTLWYCSPGKQKRKIHFLNCFSPCVTSNNITQRGTYRYLRVGMLDRCCRLPEPRSLEKPNIELEVILVLRLIWQLLLCSLLFDFPLLFILFPLILFYLFQPFVVTVFIFYCYE